MSEEAQVRTATTTLSIIEDPDQVRRVDGLVIGNRKSLVVKGGSSQHLVDRILTEFSQRLDRAGQVFVMSRSLRSLCHTDPYGLKVRIPGTQLEEYYLNEWFFYLEHVRSAPPQSIHSKAPIGPSPSYLKLLDKIPPYTVALINQSRFFSPNLVKRFTFID